MGREDGSSRRRRLRVGAGLGVKGKVANVEVDGESGDVALNDKDGARVVDVDRALDGVGQVPSKSEVGYLRVYLPASLPACLPA